MNTATYFEEEQKQQRYDADAGHVQGIGETVLAQSTPELALRSSVARTAREVWGYASPTPPKSNLKSQRMKRHFQYFPS